MNIKKELKSIDAEIKSLQRYGKSDKKSRKSSTRQMDLVDINEAIRRAYYAKSPTTFVVTPAGPLLGIQAIDLVVYGSPKGHEYDRMFTINYRLGSNSGTVPVKSYSKIGKESWIRINLPNWTAVVGTEITVTNNSGLSFDVNFLPYDTGYCQYDTWYNAIDKFYTRTKAGKCDYPRRGYYRFSGVDGTSRIKGFYITDENGNPITNASVGVTINNPDGSTVSNKVNTNQYGYLFLGLEKNDMQRGGSLLLDMAFENAYFLIDS